MRRAARFLAVLLAVAMLIAAKPYVFPKKPLEVKVFRAAVGEVRETVTSPRAGTIVSEHEATVASEAAGRIVAVKIREGERALGEQVVIELDSRDAEIELRAAKVACERQRLSLEQAKLKCKKAQEDLERASRSRSTFSESDERALEVAHELAKADVEWAGRAVAEADVAVERAAVALSKRAIRAPFPGMIRQRLVEVGELVIPGKECFAIYDDQHTYVRAPVDEVDLPRIAIGCAVDVTLQSFPDLVFRGRVREIDPGVRTTEELNRTGDVKVDLLEDQDPASEAKVRERDASYAGGATGPIRVGMSADIEVVSRAKPRALKVPAYAVHEEEDARYVYVVASGAVERRAVKIGYSNWDYSEVAEGLAAGDPVIVSLDLEGLKAGAPAVIVGEVHGAAK